MNDTKTTATAVVTLTISVHLDQPWTGEATLAAVQKRARAEALEQLAHAATELAARKIKVGAVQSVRIVLNEEPVK